MKIFKAEQVREADAFTIKHEPISSIDLMERAATKASGWIKRHFAKQTNIAVLVGPGNNGGDGLVIARHLLESGYAVQVFDLEISKNYSTDFLINKERLENIQQSIIKFWSPNIDWTEYNLVIDAILGSGLTRPIKGDLAQIIKSLNTSKTKVVAVDIPSGLFGEDNSNNILSNIVKADYTLSFQFPKLSFLFPENSDFVGKMEILDIGVHPQYIKEAQTPFFLTQKKDIISNFLKRKLFSHKGTFGHAFLWVGSKGKMGAAILATRACLRSGAGLVSAWVPESENMILQIAVPEAMTINKSQTIHISDFSAIGLGPGISQVESSLENLVFVLEQSDKALVLDADALNLLARHPQLFEKLPPNSILTPHPKELERLIGKTNDSYSRLFRTQELSQKYQIYILIKGAYSAIVCPNGEIHFNSTGNPGMATAGSGDVLTGIITAFLAQGLDSFNALRTAVFVHGLAGDFAKQEQGEQALIASDIINNIGKSLMEIRKK